LRGNSLRTDGTLRSVRCTELSQPDLTKGMPSAHLREGGMVVGLVGEEEVLLAALLRHDEWLSSLSGEGQQHELKTYFTNVGG